MVSFIKSKKFLLILILLVFIRSSTALALEIDWPPSPGGTVLDDDSDVGDMVKYFYEWAIALGGIATFFALILGGFQYISSMGKPEAMKEARERITSAIWGLILLLSSWLILNTINPDLTTFRRNSYNLDYLNEMLEALSIEELPSCDYVELFPGEDYGGGAMEIEGKEREEAPKNIRLTAADGYRKMTPQSSKAFTSEALVEFDCSDPDLNTECASPEYGCGCTCPEYGCGCVLQLFKTDGGDLCGSKIGEMSASSRDLLSQEGGTEENITCVRLSGIGCRCRELDDQGECTTNFSTNTAWGDNEFRCFGEDRRCLDGKCINCKGMALPDGCGGCSNRELIPGYTGSSELACWYVGSVAFLEGGKSCKTTCARHGGCIDADWNDNGSCTTGEALWNCKGFCRMELTNADPGYWGSEWGFWDPGCVYRHADLSQDCDQEYWLEARRFCVCEE